ncbi:MAG: BON domain-containing protein [Candidatus Sericytochromatia bacterium]|nr:BON domain-containing protein [Candidatus Sericytochromatia bacterium]
MKDSELSAFKINVNSKNGNVLLKGTAPTKEAKDRAESLAKSAKNVLSVDNQLLIGSPGNVTNNPTLNDTKDALAQSTNRIVSATSNAYEATKEKAAEIGQDAKKSMNDPNSSLNKTVGKVEVKIDAAAINLSVNAKIAADNELSALKVNVDVKNGRVLLKGTAPNSEAKSRATELAKQVNGVVSVDNQLVVVSK